MTPMHDDARALLPEAPDDPRDFLAEHTTAGLTAAATADAVTYLVADATPDEDEATEAAA